MSEEGYSQILMQEFGKAAESDLCMALLRYVTRWEETKNPHWIDLAAIITTSAGLPLAPCLQEIVAHVARRRLNGQASASGGATVIEEEIRNIALASMA